MPFITATKPPSGDISIEVISSSISLRHNTPLSLERAVSRLVVDRGRMLTEPFSFAGYVVTMSRMGDDLFRR